MNCFSSLCFDRTASLRRREAGGLLPCWRSPAIGHAVPIPDIDDRNRRGEIEQFFLGKLRGRFSIDLIADAAAKLGQRLGPSQRRAFARGELRRLAPDHHEIDLVAGYAQPFRLQNMILNAKGAAVDLRGAYLHKLEQLLVESGLAGQLAQREYGVVDI